jgi:mitogen-activated protein kinase organizer 1
VFCCCVNVYFYIFLVFAVFRLPTFVSILVSAGLQNNQKLGLVLLNYMFACFFLCLIVDGKYCFTGGADRSIRLWNPSRLDPAYPIHPINTSTRLDEEHLIGSDRDVETLPRAFPIQTYGDGVSYPISAVATGATDDDIRYVLSGSGNVAVLHDVVTGQCVRRFQGHVGRINDVTFSSGAETCISASYDTTVRIWDGRNRSSKANNEPIQILKDAKDSVTVIKTIQNNANTLICTASVDGNIRTYDLRKGIIRCDYCDSPIIGMALTNDATNIVASCLDGTIRLIDFVNTYHSGHTSGNYSLNCCVTSNDCTVVTGSENGAVALYDLVKAHAVQELTGHTSPTCSIACHPSRSDVIISASYDSNTVVWANDMHYMSWI